MKHLVVVFVLLLAGSAMAYDYVDIGDPISEPPHALAGWGPVEPANSSGNYGGIDDCRCIWYDTGDPDNVDAPDATLTLDFGTSDLNCLNVSHLVGLADDSFELYLNNNLVFTFADPGTPGEIWITDTIEVNGYSGIVTVRLLATGDAWDGFGTYGQVCFDFLELFNVSCTVPNEKATWGAIKALY